MFLKNFIKRSNDSADTDITLQEAVNIMADNKLHYIVLLKDQKPEGLLTERDIVKLLNSSIDFSEKAIDHAVKKLVTAHGKRLAQHACLEFDDRQ